MKVERLLRATPVRQLEAQVVGAISGLPGRTFEHSWGRGGLFLYEPPAARRDPFVDPVLMATTIQIMEGADEDAALRRALRFWSDLRPSLDVFDCPIRYEYADLNSPSESVPLPLLLEALWDKGLAGADNVQRWNEIHEAVMGAAFYPVDRSGDAVYRLCDLPELSSPSDLPEDLAGLPEECLTEAAMTDAEWRKLIRPAAARLHAWLGKPVIHLDDPSGADSGHRFMAMHRLASLLPASPFVRYLVEASGAKDVEELRATLIDPKSFTLEFDSRWNMFDDHDIRPLRIDAAFG